MTRITVAISSTVTTFMVIAISFMITIFTMIPISLIAVIMASVRHNITAFNPRDQRRAVGDAESTFDLLAG